MAKTKAFKMDKDTAAYIASQAHGKQLKSASKTIKSSNPNRTPPLDRDLKLQVVGFKAKPNTYKNDKGKDVTEGSTYALTYRINDPLMETEHGAQYPKFYNIKPAKDKEDGSEGYSGDIAQLKSLLQASLAGTKGLSEDDKQCNDPEKWAPLIVRIIESGMLFRGRFTDGSYVGKQGKMKGKTVKRIDLWINGPAESSGKAARFEDEGSGTASGSASKSKSGSASASASKSGSASASESGSASVSASASGSGSGSASASKSASASESASASGSGSASVDAEKPAKKGKAKTKPKK